MRTAQTVLTVIQKRGTHKQDIERVYKLLFNRELYLSAYARLYSNDGAMTKGANDETVDGMSMKKIDKIIDALKNERYEWTPVRRIYIEKKNSSKKRPLGIPSWSDKLLQEVMRQILEAYYEPQFSEHSHGFRPNHGCHTALSEIRTWKGTKWFIEGDISKCFDKIDHTILIEILGQSIKDNRFLRLVKNMLNAGYIEDWKYNSTLSGTPQGGIISPLLANIYMNQFDKWLENELLPQFNIGKRQKGSKEYSKFSNSIANCYKIGDKETARKLKIKRRNIPSIDTYDENYRRLRFVRYADDFILGFTGLKAEAENIKTQLAEFLDSKLKLTLSKEKTFITNATSDFARFLNYNLKAQRANDYIDPTGRRGANGVIGLFVPADVVESKCRTYMRKNKTIHMGKLINDDDFSIIETFQQEYRGVVQYYMMAQNVCWFGKLHWVMEGSLLKTLACKHRSSMKKIKNKYQSEVVDERTGKTLKCLKKIVEREGKKPLVAQWGGISLSYDKKAIISDTPYVVYGGRNELIKRLLADICELCGSKEHIVVHHVRKLSDLQMNGRKEKPVWAQIMSARRRKSLVVCHKCHVAIHKGTI